MEENKIDMSVEMWKDIKGYEGIYQVSNYGRVKTLDRISNNNIKIKEGLKAIRMSGGGGRSKNHKRALVTFKLNGIQKSFSVCKLVYETFNHEIDNFHCIWHKDKNPENNKIDNLITITMDERFKMSKKAKSSVSKYRGVTYLKDRDLWRTQIQIKGNMNAIGTFKTEINAAIAYDNWLYENYIGFYETNDSLGLL